MKNVKINEKITNNKLKLVKKIKTLLVVTTLSTGLLGCGKEEEIGKIINIGNHKEFSSILNEIKIQFAHFKNDDLGLIVTPSKLSESNIFNDVEIVKNYLSKFDVTLPVYLDIEAVMKDRDTNLTKKKTLIHTFLEKCKNNNISVGVYGTDSLLTKFYEELDFKDYGAYIIKENNELTYPGNVHVTKELNDKLTIREDLSSIISEKNKNNKDKFKSDYIHTIGSEDTIDTVANLYNISANDLLKYNNLRPSKVKLGTSIKIPNKEASSTIITENEAVANVKVKNNTEIISLKTPILGCDISRFQTNPNWTQMKENFDFVIVSTGRGLEGDNMFESHTKNCMENDIKMGIYCFNKVRGIDYTNIEDFKNALITQTNYVLDLIKDKKVTYPVYLDLENDDAPFTQCYTKEQLDLMLDLWKNMVAERGYIPGIYANKTNFNYISQTSSIDIPNTFEIWIAGGPQYNNEYVGLDFRDIKPVANTYTFKGQTHQLDTAQVCEVGINAGAGNGRGFLDINYSYTDYELSNVLSAYENITNITNFKEFNLRTLYSLKEEIALLALAMGLTLKYEIKKYKKDSKEFKKTI